MPAPCDPPAFGQQSNRRRLKLEEPRLKLSAEYRAALSAYLADAAGTALQRACECGWAAVELDLGLLELGAIHRDALHELLAAPAAPFDAAQLAQRASAFFLESLAAFDMSGRASQAVNDCLPVATTSLQSANAELRREVRERQQAEEAVRKSEEKFSKAFHSSPAGMTITRGADRVMLEANDTCSRILGYRRDELVGRTTLEIGLVSVEDRTRLAELISTQGFVHDLEIDVRTKAGEIRRVQYSAEIIELEGEDCVLATIHDISELRRTEAALERQTAQLAAANRELEAFSYSVSHDLRAPLRSIDGFARLLERDSSEALSETGKRHLQVVRNNAQRMGQLIDDLLSLSRLNRQTIRRQTVQLTPFVRQALDELHADQNGRHIEISLAELGECQADPSLLKQVWLNLLANALKYTRKREIARVEIGCCTEDGEQVYYVRDNGAGFDMAYASKLFGVFQRLHRMEDFEGTGVGLAIVQQIVTRHGGRIWAEAAVEQGAAFYFTLGAAPEGDRHA